MTLPEGEGGTPGGEGAMSAIGVAVLDDDARIAETVVRFLRPLGCRTRIFSRPSACLQAFQDAPLDILITDIEMPEMDGIRVLAAVKEAHPSTEVIVVTGHADKERAIEALRLGAFDFFEKPIDRGELVETIKRTARYQSVLRERDRLAERLSILSRRDAERWGIQAFVGTSPGIRSLLEATQRLQRTRQTSVLILGESGTGKELIARALHYGSERAAAPFIAVNCAAVPADLAESLWFGHVRGAFTGALTDRKGSFEEADGGTLFLDEVGDMPRPMQAKLLRVLEDGIVVPVGKTSGHKVDVRVVGATNTDLQARMATGDFRADLFYRMAAYTLQIPPLRERTEDIPLLARHFIRQVAAEMSFPAPDVEADALEAMQRHPFPGNVRELRNVVEHALIESQGKAIGVAHLRFLGGTPPPGRTVAPAEETDLPLNLQEAEAVLIRRAMLQAGGNVAAAARLLGINRTKLYRKMQRTPA